MAAHTWPDAETQTYRYGREEPRKQLMECPTRSTAQPTLSKAEIPTQGVFGESRGQQLSMLDDGTGVSLGKHPG